jgi:hypothetical protein
MIKLKRFARIALWQLQLAPVQNFEIVGHAVSVGDVEKKEGLSRTRSEKRNLMRQEKVFRVADP